jgi:hypothetical protein
MSVSSSLSSSEDEDEVKVGDDVNLIGIPSELGEVADEDKLSTITRCLWYTCTQSAVAVIVKLLEIWGSPNYDGEAFRITLSRPGLCMTEEISTFTMRKSCLEKLESLIEPGYIIFEGKLSVRTRTFSRLVRGYAFKVLSLDDALEIAKKRYNTAITRRRQMLRINQTLRRRINTVVVALVADPKERNEQKAVKRKIRDLQGDNCKKTIIKLIHTADADYDIGDYYDMVFCCGKSVESHTLYNARKKRASQNVWADKESHFEDEDAFFAIVKNEINSKDAGNRGRPKKRKKKTN